MAAMEYNTPEVVKGTAKDENGKLKMTGLKCFLPLAGEMTDAVRIVIEGVDRFGRYQNGYAIFAVNEGGKRKTLVVPARQEKSKLDNRIYWSAVANRVAQLATDEESHKILLEGLREARNVSL